MNQIVPCILVWLFGFYSGVAIMALFSATKSDIKERVIQTFTYQCERCRKPFDPELTDDPDLKICYECMSELRSDPNDSYFHN